MFSIKHSGLIKICHAIFCSAAIFLAQPNFAQDKQDITLSADELEYYLIQAFQAATAKDRIALNHIGIEVIPADNGYLVSASLEGYPAHQAGIERGDKIVRVDGKAYHPIYSFNAKDRNPSEFMASTKIHTLEFERRGETVSVELAPVFENLYDSYRSATLNSVQTFSVGNKIIGYIRFWGLSRSTSDFFTLERTMRSLKGCDGIIIDLRNSYGYLSSKHLDMFMRNGRGNFTVSDTSNQHAAITSNSPALVTQAFTRPIAVLVNSKTRGGAELFAYGLAKSGKTSTLGEKSPGKIGNYTLEGNGLRYFPADQVLIDSQEFESIGIVPEHIIPFPFAESRRNDPQFEASIDALLGRI